MFPFRRRSRLAARRAFDEAGKKLLIYEMITQRELEHDALMWQSPALALTAQAFLFTITLDPAYPAAARVTSAGLGVVVILLSMQLMAKHRHLAMIERDRLRQLEDELGLPATAKHGWTMDSGGVYRDREGKATPPLRRISSYRVWICGLWIILAVNAAAAVAALISS